MDNEQKRYILDNARKIPVDKIARSLGLKERKVRKFLELEEGKKRPVAISLEAVVLSTKQWLLVCLSLLVLGFLIYSNTFHASFHFDDDWSIVRNPGMLNAFDLGFLWKAYGLRFFTYFTLALNYHFGQLDVFGYHLVNISIHIVASILAFFFLYLTAQTPWMKRNPLSLPAFWVAFGGALLFLSHPIQTQAVTYIVQRAASLATLLYVSTMVCYIQWRLKKNLLFYGLAILSGCLAMLSKEIAVTLPFALLLYEFFFFDREERKSSRIALWIIPFFLLLLLFIPLLNYYKVFETANLPTESQALSRGQYLLTQFRVIVTYTRLLFLPLHQTLDYHFPLSRTLGDPATFLSFLFLAGILFSAVALFKRFRLLSFGIFWFFLTLSVESSIIPLRDVIFEHRVYLPMVGFCFVFCGVLCGWIKDAKIWGILLIVVMTALSCLTYRRNAVWLTEFTLWGDVIQKEPQNERGYDRIGIALQKQNQYEEAIKYHLKAYELSSSGNDTIMHLGLAYKGAGQHDKAIELFRKGITLYRDQFPDFYNNLGVTLDDMGRDDEAVTNYLHAIKIAPQYPDAHCNIGVIYAKKGEFEKATEQVRVLESLRQTRYVQSLINSIRNQGLDFRSAGQNDKAVDWLKKVTRYFGDQDAVPYNSLGVVLDDMGRYDEAVENYLHAIKINPGYSEAYFNLGLVYASRGELAKAEIQVRTLENLHQTASVKQLADYIKSQEKKIANE